MRTRPRVVLACIVGVLAAGYFVLWITGPGPGINRQSFARIQVGMSESEVTAVLRTAPGDYITGKPRVKVFNLTSEFPRLIPIDAFREHRAIERQEVDPRVKEWYADDGIILVWFENTENVKEKAFFEVVREHEPWLVKIRRWLRM